MHSCVYVTRQQNGSDSCTEILELSVVAQNVFESAHREWNAELFVPGTKIPRTVYGKVALRF